MTDGSANVGIDVSWENAELTADKSAADAELCGVRKIPARRHATSERWLRRMNLDGDCDDDVKNCQAKHCCPDPSLYRFLLHIAVTQKENGK